MNRQVVSKNNYINKNLISQSSFQGFSVIQSRGPMLNNCLSKISEVLANALIDHPRTFAFRVDLRLPSYDFSYDEDRLVERFIASLKKKLKHNREMARKAANGWVPDTRVRYVWAREMVDAGKPHFHFMIFVNRDAFHKLGIYELGRDNMYNRLIQAWASALSLNAEQAFGLVHIPANAMYELNAGFFQSQNEAFFRASYFAKFQTKSYGAGRHTFGGSRG